MLPLRTATEFANKLIRGRVAAARVCRVMALTPDVVEPASPAPRPPPGSELHDARSGLRVRPGSLTADRLRPARRLGPAGRPARAVRGRAGRRGLARRHAAHVARARGRPRADHGLRHRRGPVRRPPRRPASTSAATASVERRSSPPRPTTSSSRCPTASTRVVTEKGRSFSGGQRQRLVLARALAADPEVLVLVEPTSAVDAHTEARIASRLRAHRGGPHHGRDDGQPARCWTRSTRSRSWSTVASSPSAPTRTCSPSEPGLPPRRRARRGGRVMSVDHQAARSPTARPYAATSARSRTATRSCCGRPSACTCWPP